MVFFSFANFIPENIHPHPPPAQSTYGGWCLQEFLSAVLHLVVGLSDLWPQFFRVSYCIFCQILKILSFWFNDMFQPIHIVGKLKKKLQLYNLNLTKFYFFRVRLQVNNNFLDFVWTTEVNSSFLEIILNITSSFKCFKVVPERLHARFCFCCFFYLMTKVSLYSQSWKSYISLEISSFHSVLDSEWYVIIWCANDIRLIFYHIQLFTWLLVTHRL